jgi:hypothetical protein
VGVGFFIQLHVLLEFHPFGQFLVGGRLVETYLGTLRPAAADIGAQVVRPRARVAHPFDLRLNIAVDNISRYLGIFLGFTPKNRTLLHFFQRIRADKIIVTPRPGVRVHLGNPRWVFKRIIRFVPFDAFDIISEILREAS